MSNSLQFRQLLSLPGTIFLATISWWTIATQSLPKQAIANPIESLPSESFQISPQPTAELAQTTPILQIQEIRGTGTATIDGNPTTEGSTLGVGQELTTGENTTVRLLVEGRGGSIEVSEYSRVMVGGLSSGQIDLEILQGRARFAVVPLPGMTSAGTENSAIVAATKELSIFDPVPPLERRVRGDRTSEDIQAQGSSRGNYNFRVRTPTGVAGVRGTSFGVDVGPNGQTGISGLSGSVVAEAQNQDRLVNRGQYVVISPDSPPTIIEPTPAQAELKFLVRQTRGGDTVRVFGQVDRLDLVYINGEAIETDPDGNFAVVMERPANRRLRFVVRGPAVRERVYVIPVR